MNEEEKQVLNEKCEAMANKIIDLVEEEGNHLLSLTVLVDLINRIVFTFDDPTHMHELVMKSLQQIYQKGIEENDKT